MPVSMQYGSDSAIIENIDKTIYTIVNDVKIPNLQLKISPQIEIPSRSNTTVTWSTPFPNACLAVIPVTDQGGFAAASTFTVYYETMTAASFQCFVYNTANVSQKVHFIGIGY